MIDWIVKWGTLEDEDMKNDEFCGGIDFMEAFEDNITALQTIIGRIRSINENAVRKAA